MAPHPPPRMIPAWLPAAALLAAITLAGVTLAWLLRAHAWWVYLGLVLAVLLAVGALERFREKRSAPRPPRARGRLKVLPGGKAVDLEKDDPEHRQRWLM